MISQTFNDSHWCCFLSDFYLCVCVCVCVCARARTDRTYTGVARIFLTGRAGGGGATTTDECEQDLVLVLVLVQYCTQRPGELSRYSGQGHLWQQQLNFEVSFVDQTTYVHVGQDCFKLVKVGGCLHTIW